MILSKDSGSASRWGDLPNELIRAIASYLPENEVATSFKLVNQHYARSLSEFRVVRLSQPLPQWTQRNFPPRAVAGLVLASQPWPSHGFVAHWGRPEPWRCLTLPQRRRLLSLAASSGDAGSLEAALAHCGCTGFEEPAASAALAGRVSVCEKLVSREISAFRTVLLCFAAEAGHLEVCRWFWRELATMRQATTPSTGMHVDIASQACAMACRGGHEEVLSWMQGVYEQEVAEAMTRGLGEGHELEGLEPEAVEEQEGEGEEEQEEEVEEEVEVEEEEEAAAEEEQDEGQVQQQQQQQPPAQAAARSTAELAHAVDMALSAAGGGQVAWCTRWADIAGPQQYLMAALPVRAAVGCDLPGLQQLSARYSPPSAALRRVRKLAVPYYAAASPTPDWRDKVDWALQQDPLDIVEGPEAHHVVAQLLDSEVGIFRAAASFPDLHLRLQHLRSRGLPLLCAADFVKHAAAAGNAAALTWLLDQPEGQELAASAELGQAAAAAGHVPVLECLRARGLVFDIAHATAAAEACRGEALRWMAGALAEGDAAAWSGVWRCAAAAGVDLSTLRLLHERWGAAVDLDAVAKGGSVEALEWAFGLLEQEQAGPAGVAGGGTAGASVVSNYRRLPSL